jgi:hypothetical protein
MFLDYCALPTDREYEGPHLRLDILGLGVVGED